MSKWLRPVGLGLMLGGALVLFVMVGLDLLDDNETQSVEFEQWVPLTAVVIGALMVLATAGLRRPND